MSLPKETITYTFPTTIDFGIGSRHNISAYLKEKKCLRPVIVTDRGVAQLSWLKALHEELQANDLNVSLFSEIWGNPVKSQVLAGAAAAQSHDADSLIAIGGGAAMDVSKLIALMMHHPGDLFDYEDGKPGALPINKKLPILLAMPTTAGTGSEVGRSAVVSDDATKVKKIIFSPRLLPEKVFADPQVTLELPAHITAATGMDALTHALESFLAKGFHPICDGIALEGLYLISRHLRNAVRFAKKKMGETPEHLEARGQMLNAAMMGAIAFQKGLGANHSCAHALSTICDLHHGLANGIMLPYVMNFNRKEVPKLFDRLARTIGLDSGSDVVTWIEDLKKDIGIPRKLSEVGVTQEQISSLVDIAVGDVCHPLNPRPVTRENFEQLFKEAL